MMALYDNKRWMLSHIRNSYITTDDTGICELVMASDNMPMQLKQKLSVFPTSNESDSDSDDFVSESYDIRFEGDFSMRYRSNTAACLEKLDHEKKKTAKMKIVKWVSPKEPLNEEDLNDMFTVKVVKRTCSPKKSLLTYNLEQCTHLPLNPYLEYSKFDGSAYVSIPVRRYRIYLSMLPEAERNYPMDICCIASARIRDLIGLVLLKCSTRYGDVELKPVSHYGLYICEDDGEVDTAFPCLDPKECVAKFGFTCLGLVEQGEGDDDSSGEQRDSLTIATSSSADRDTEKQYNSSLLAKMNEAKQMMTDLQLLDGHNRAMVAPLYKSYCVNIVNKMRTKVEVYLGISSDKLEIDPIQQKSSKLVPFLRQKPVSHHMDSVAWCEMTDKKGSKSTFRVIYAASYDPLSEDKAGTSSNNLQSSASFKHYDFEADHITAEEIVQKINLILDIRSSLTRKEFIAARERKHYKKKSYSTSK